MQCFEVGVAGIVVAIKTKVGAALRLERCARDNQRRYDPSMIHIFILEILCQLCDLAVNDFFCAENYPPMCTMVRDAGTKSASPMWCRSSFFTTTPRMNSSNSVSLAPRRI